MVYTAEIKKQLDNIMEAFADYIRRQSYFDILYSEKAGYLRIIAEAPDDEAPMRIDTPDELLETLIDDMADDVIEQRLPTTLLEDEDLPGKIKAEIYRQIMENVKKIAGDREHYVHLAINYYQERFERKTDGVEHDT